MARVKGRTAAIERARWIKGGQTAVSTEAPPAEKRLTNTHRILRRLAGQMRLSAMNMEDRPLATKLLLMAIELEDAAKERRAKSARRN